MDQRQQPVEHPSCDDDVHRLFVSPRLFRDRRNLQVNVLRFCLPTDLRKSIKKLVIDRYGNLNLTETDMLFITYTDTD